MKKIIPESETLAENVPEEIKSPSDNDASKEAELPEVKVPVTLIYCGPNIPGGLLQKYALYKGGVPDHFNEIIKKCPVIKNLFVAVNELAATQKALEIPGTPQNTFYAEVLAFLKKGGK
jgi:hypothetical protein